MRRNIIDVINVENGVRWSSNLRPRHVRPLRRLPFVGRSLLGPGLTPNILASNTATIAYSFLIKKKTKKKKYLKACLQQRRSFVPFAVSTDGLLGPEAQMFVKKLAADLSVRWDQPKSVVTNFIRARLGIAILRTTHHCIRGFSDPCT
eukprot:scaffold1988_cov121-Cylindrotheca_fusiformis.AAC.5